MPSQTTSPLLTHKFVEALAYTAELHADQVRKGSGVPYIGHLLSVAGLVIEDGGTEKQVIAALLHDAVEDQGGEPTRAEIARRFGEPVASVVAECSDTFESRKPPWRERKEAYIEHLREASDDAVLVSLADKLDNARAIMRDLRGEGAKVWQRFSVKDPNDHLWYYGSLLKVFQERSSSWMVGELDRVIETLKQAVKDA